MIIHSSTVRQIITNNMKPGIWYHVSDIQDLVEKHYNLNEEDRAPHTETRDTLYPRWKARIQGVLSDMKNKDLISHDIDNSKYSLK